LRKNIHYEFFFSRFRDIDDNTNRGNHVANIGIRFVWRGSRTGKKHNVMSKTPCNQSYVPPFVCAGKTADERRVRLDTGLQIANRYECLQ